MKKIILSSMLGLALGFISLVYANEPFVEKEKCDDYAVSPYNMNRSKKYIENIENKGIFINKLVEIVSSQSDRILYSCGKVFWNSDKAQ